ncbi:MAG: hypothetical protein ACREQL_03025, partial [Candidatus Binatia bacterium]
MVTAEGLLAFSARIECWLAVLAGATIVLLAVRAHVAPGRPDGASSLNAPISRRVEYLILGVILVAAALSRVVGWDDAVTPAFWFSQATTLYVGRLLEQGAAWSSCGQRLWVTHVNGEHESAILLPVLTALQSWLGAHFGLPVLGGAVFGVLAVGLAWLFGRQVRSPVFGLLFAAFVAASPMQLMWSRLGSHFSGAVAHVLLALVIGYAAGRRESIVLAAVAGLVAWASVYHYYAARVAIPLTFFALLTGTPRAATLGRRLVLGFAWAAALVGIAYALERGAVAQAFWPQYGGYPGNKGESSLGEFVTVNRIAIAHEARATLERYFVRGRTGDGWLGQPGMENGGLAFVPTALLGALGLFDVLRRIRRQWIWLALAAAGLAVPALSVMTARRALVFDLAWAALAAHGVLTLVDGGGRGWPRRARAWAAGAMVAVIALWGTVAVFALSAVLPASSGRHIPFGEAGFGDGVACKRCVEAGRQWEQDIADGAFVVAFDNDAAREHRMSPGGLPLYGKIGALVAGAPDRFVEGYALMAGLDPEPPTPGPMFDRSSTDFATHLSARIDRAAPRRLVWHFERPTRWERWLAYRLRAAGGMLERFST